MRSRRPGQITGGRGRGAWLAATFTAVASLGLVLTFARPAPQRPALTRAGRAGPETLAKRLPSEPPAVDLKVRVGDRLPNLVFRRMDGAEVHLGDYAGGLPLVLEFGSFT
jgi:hypothetical protein